MPDGWRMVTALGDVRRRFHSNGQALTRRQIDGEFPVELCNYTDVFYNLPHPARNAHLMRATASSKARVIRWTT